jgi:hypothetical protein
MNLIESTLTELNNCINLDMQQSLLNVFGDDDDNPYSLINIDAKFYDPNSFMTQFSNDSRPLFLNLNVQSLNSKHSELSIFINELYCKNIFPDVMCLQEIWQIPDENIVSLQDYNFVYKKEQNLEEVV